MDVPTELIGDVIPALEGGRAIIRGLRAEMLNLQLSHPGGTHRELNIEIDELRARIEQLEANT